MKTIAIYARLFRRSFNSWIEHAKYLPEKEQRAKIVDRMMKEGEPKNWAVKC